MFLTRSRLLLLILLMVGAVVSTGCDDDDDSVMGPDPEVALLRVMHLSPDAGPVDIWLDGSVILEDVVFNGTSLYYELEPGDYRVQVSPADQASPIVIDETLTLAGGMAYTAVAVGLLGDSSLSTLVLVDDLGTDPNHARVRFVHASPGTPAVDVTLTDGTVLFDDVPFGEVDEDVLITGPGAVDVQARVAGTQTVAVSFADLPLAIDFNYTVFAQGLLSDGTLAITVVVDNPAVGSNRLTFEPAEAQIRVAHLSPDAPNVDVYLNDTLVGALVDVPFKAISEYLTVGAQTHNIKVYATGETANSVVDADLTLLPGSISTVAATGLLGAGDLRPIVLNDAAPSTGIGNVVVRFVHASPDAPAVDVRVADGGPVLFDAVSFRDAEEFLLVDGGTYDLEVVLDASGGLALELPGVVLPEGEVITVFAVGRVADSSLDALLQMD